MKKIYLLFVLFSISINAQNLGSDSTITDAIFINEINKIRISNDSIKTDIEGLKLSITKKLNSTRRFSAKLNDIIKLNYSENKSLNDSLFNKSEELLSKINLNENKLEKHNLIQTKNTDLYLNIKKKTNERMVIMTVFLVIIFVCLFYFKFYYDKQNKKLKSEYDLKLNETVLSISALNDELKAKIDSLSKSIKILSKDLEKIKSSLED
tara:strand:+ start:1837 stop:2463 length:627 start_codon:yes stop_codon:yes gene_type:complete